MKEPVRRRSQAERKVSLHRAVLEAAVTTLYTHGYAGTTTVAVAKAAGISRGAMANHFATKADLMIFVVEAVYADEKTEYARLLAGVESPRERTLAYVDAAWQVLARPTGVAVLEILMGSRSDETLTERLKAALHRIQADAFARLEEEMQLYLSPDLLRLIVWAIRGLSIENILSGERTESSVHVLRTLIERTFDLDDQARRLTSTP